MSVVTELWEFGPSKMGTMGLFVLIELEELILVYFHINICKV